MFFQIIECVFAGIGVGFDAFFKVFPLYWQLKSIPVHLIALATGIPFIICSVIIFLSRSSTKHVKN